MPVQKSYNGAVFKVTGDTWSLFFPTGKQSRVAPRAEWHSQAIPAPSRDLPCSPALLPRGKPSLGWTLARIQRWQSRLLPCLLALPTAPLRSAGPASRAPEHQRNVM